MTDWRQQNIDTYNRSAKELAEYFRGIGSRVNDIEKALQLAGNPASASVVEIGCGDGRDAKEIVRRAAWYLGFDVAEELIKLARQHVPGANFEVADVASFPFPDNLDVVFAFASLLHSDKDEVAKVLQRVAAALKPGGIFYISLKAASRYEQRVKEDRFGKRLFYFYTPELISQLAGSSYETVFTDFQYVGNTDWFTIALKRAK